MWHGDPDGATYEEGPVSGELLAGLIELLARDGDVARGLLLVLVVHIGVIHRLAHDKLTARERRERRREEGAETDLRCYIPHLALGRGHHGGRRGSAAWAARVRHLGGGLPPPGAPHGLQRE